MLDEDQVKTLQDIFYHKNYNPSFDILRKLTPKSIKTKDLKIWYDSQKIVQCFKPYYKPESLCNILSYEPMTRIQADTMFIRRFKIAIVCIIDLFTKYAYCKVYSNTLKDDGITSAKATKALKEFLQIIKDKFNYGSVGEIKTDEGSEFKGQFEAFCKASNISHIFSPPSATKRPMGPIERFNRTLRQYIDKYKINHRSEKLTQEKINQLTNAYNNTPHSSILKYTPTEAFESNPMSEISLYNEQRKKKCNPKKLPLKSYVRIYLKKDTDQFKKGAKNWSSEIYQIENYDKTRNLYALAALPAKAAARKVNDKYYPYDYLQIINKENYDKYNYEVPTDKTPSDEKKQADDETRPKKKIAITKDIKDVLNEPILETKRVRKLNPKYAEGAGVKLTLEKLEPLPNNAKYKYVAFFSNNNKVKFGAQGYIDYTLGASEKQRENYRKRHAKDLKIDDPTKAGFLSYYILWGDSRDIDKNIKDFKKKFHL